MALAPLSGAIYGSSIGSGAKAGAKDGSGAKEGCIFGSGAVALAPQSGAKVAPKLFGSGAIFGSGAKAGAIFGSGAMAPKWRQRLAPLMTPVPKIGAKDGCGAKACAIMALAPKLAAVMQCLILNSVCLISCLFISVYKQLFINKS